MCINLCCVYPLTYNYRVDSRNYQRELHANELGISASDHLLKMLRMSSSTSLACKTNGKCRAWLTLGKSRKLVRLQVTSLPTAPAPSKKDPFAEKTVYNDNFLDKLFIKIYSKKMANQLQGVVVPEKPTYDDFVRISSEIMKGRNSEEQRKVVRDVLMSLLPAEAPPIFRKLFPPNQFSAEFNALIASLGFYWLVGESEVREEEVVVGPNGEKRRQKSVVHIKKCRYLEKSGCVGMCLNMCKVPTQTFFTEEFGLPLTMNPDFEDLSCSMIFGQAPPPITEDAAYTQPCFAVQCAIAAGKGDGSAPPPCPKVDTERGKASLATQQAP